MLKKLNPAWFYLIVAIAIIPCFYEKSNIGFIFNSLGIGLGYISTEFIVIGKVATFFYLCSIVFLIFALFRKRYDNNAITPIVLMSLFNIISCFLWAGISSEYSLRIIKLHAILTIIFGTSMLLLAGVKLFSIHQKNKQFYRYLWIPVSIFKIMKYISGLLASSALVYQTRTVRKPFFTIVQLLQGEQKIYYYVSIIVAIIDIVGTALFLYNLFEDNFILKERI